MRRALDDVLSRLPGAESYHERYNDRFTRQHLDTIVRARDAIQQRLLSGRTPTGGGGGGTLAGAAGPSPAGQGSGTLAGQRPAGASGGSGTLVGQRPAGVGARGPNTLVSPRPGDVDTRVLPGSRPGGAPDDTRVTNRGGGSSRAAGIGRSVRLGLGTAIAVTNIRACIAEGKDPASCIAKEGGKAVVLAGVGLAVGAVVGTASTPVIVVAAGTGVVLTGLGAKGARDRLINAEVVNEINDKLFPAQLAKLQAGLKALEGLANDARSKIEAANGTAGGLSSIRADILNGLRQRQSLLDPSQVRSFCGQVKPKALEVLFGAENVLDAAREANSKFAQAIRTMNACIADPASAQESVLQDANTSIGEAKSLAREAAEDYTTLLTEAEQIEALFDDLEADVLQKIESADRALDTNREALQTLLEGVQGEAEAADQAFHTFADARDRLLADVDHSYAVLKDF
ncbi:MAG: hypothetical protein MI673_07245, partial [Thiotrichales bacterium]|nr:hypothetical protein [Thiotrichales bacterium]